jgi:hypothetical protein
MLTSFPPLLKTSLAAARAMARSASDGASVAGFGAANRNDPVCAAAPSALFANKLSSW